MDIKYKLFPYPVLWNKNDDYKTSTFDCDIQLQREIKKFNLKVHFKLDNTELAEMIRNEEVEYILHIESSATSYRLVKNTKNDNLSFELIDKNLLGKINLCPFIVAKKDLIDFTNSDWNSEYDNTKFKIYKGSILAIGTQQSFSAERENDDLSHLPSIFMICKKETDEKSPIEINLSSDKIRIMLNINDYNNYSNFKFGNNDNINIINSFLIFPTLVFAFEKLRENFEEFKEYRWFSSIKKIFEKYYKSFNEDLFKSDSVTSFELAQEILELPISKSLISLNNINNLENIEEE